MEEPPGLKDSQEWESQLEALKSASTNVRIDALKKILQDIENSGSQDHSSREILATLPHLLATYPRYLDRKSRRSIQACIRSYLRSESYFSQVTPVLVNFLSSESAKPVIASSNAFVLLEWCCLVQQEMLRHEQTFETSFGKLCSAAAAFLDKTEESNVRKSVRHSALVVARRGLRSVFRHATLGEKGLSIALKELTASSAASARNAPFIGIIAGVSARIPERNEQFQVLSKDVLDYYSKHILGSKSLVSTQQAEGLRDFFSEFVSYEDLAHVLFPAVEKSILRSPEVVFQGPIDALARVLPLHLDISELVLNKLMKPLLSSMNSTNVKIRDGAGRGLALLVARGGDVKITEKIATELSTAVKSTKAANHEVRALLSEVFASIAPTTEVSTTIVGSLVPAAAKEVNESTLRKELNAVASHLVILVQADRLEKGVSDALVKSCNDKRPQYRKAWLLCIATVPFLLESIPTTGISRDFVLATLKLLRQVYDEVSPNALPATQSGLVAAAFALPALATSPLNGTSEFKHIIPAILKNDLLSSSPKPSLLLNPKVYTKITSPDDAQWALRGLMGISGELAKSSNDSKQFWALALLHLLLSSDVDSSIRRKTATTLSRAFIEQPESIGSSIVLGLWEILHSKARDTPSSSTEEQPLGDVRLNHASNILFPSESQWHSLGKERPIADTEQLAIDTIVLLRPELIAGADWISACLSQGIDPGQLAKRQRDKLFNQIMSHFEKAKLARLSIFEIAACNATASLAFVEPDGIIPYLLQHIQADLNPDQLNDIGPTEAAIARAPEGTVFVDVISQQANGFIEDKSGKDRDILKWEQEIRAQLAQKKGAPSKKLTPDQQAKVDTQLRHETAIRERVRVLSGNLRRGAHMIQSLAQGPPTDPRLWMSPAINALIGVLKAGAAMVVDDELVSAYLACSAQVTDRLGVMRPFIGTATLRSLRNANIPSNYTDEPLGELGTRVLYRLRFAAEQRPFDTASLAYSLPLIFSVLDNAGIGEVESEDADAQVLLALEFLSFQMSSCSDTYLPRAEIMEHLISSMQKYPQHYRIVKDSLMEFCRSVSDTLAPREQDILLAATTAPQTSVRTAVLQAIQSELDLSTLEFSVNIWIACQDEEDENAETALAIWEESEFVIQDPVVDELPRFLSVSARSTRTAASKALAQALLVRPAKIDQIMSSLRTTYVDESQPLVPKRNKFGIVQKGEVTDQWEKRSGLALAFKELAIVLPNNFIVPTMKFLISNGPLSDRNGTVRSEMVEAGQAIVASKGKDCLEPLMSLLETALQEPDKGTQESDWTNEAVIVLYGSLARHLSSGDSRVKDVISKLINTLSTPSESVQYAVAMCLPALARSKDLDIGGYITVLLEQLFQDKKYAARRGAAYGLAGIIKGKGVAALRQYRVMSTLRSASENKKSPEHRQGSLFAYELLSLILGRTFEPYVIEVLPQLLACFGDPAAQVREACLDTAKTCFASLSSFGVRKVLPQLLEGLDETQWRSKKGACDLLGAMAYLDPQQLAASLPDIIPPLTAVLTDSHKEVRAAANSSLQRFGEVITNPEVKSLVNILLKALSDPTKYTEEALDALIKVSFIHYLDAPSLALVVRILERGLNDRSSTKRKAAQIIGSLAHLTEKRDIVVHLPILVSGLRIATVDPVPATRATASKALGSLVEKLGEDAFPDLIPSLMSSLRTDTGAGDRLGSAQALSEVLAGLGTGRLEETLPTILQNVASTRATVREGFMTLFIFLPACFGNSFANYLSQIIPSVLSGLADDIEAIRDISLRAGRLLVKNFATKAIDLLLPELQRGLADDSYRIRLSSVELVGDLLFNLTGISAKAEEGEEEDESAAQAGQSLLEVLGEERRNRVLSSLYICRCDTSGLVRTAAVNVWKALVATPRTLRDIVPTLIQMIINRLASSNMEHKVIAGNALGEVIRKAGEGVFSSLLPSLEEGLQTSTDVDNRQGICIALREIVNAASPDALEEHEKKLIAIVRLALVDSNADVREAAAESFDSLQQIFGKRAVDQVLPHLLNLLRSEDEAEHALSALLTLLTEQTRANVILPNLIPTLLTNPITAFNARALASLAKVGGSSMTRRLPVILNSLADNLVKCKDDDLKQELNASFDAVLQSVDEFDGLNTAMSVMLAMMKNDDHHKRAVAAFHLASFFATPVVDYSRYNQDLIRVLLISFGDRDKDVVAASWSALNQLQTHLRKEEMESLVPSTRQVLQQAGTSGSLLPGFILPKGILPVLQIFLQGLMNGTTEQRVQAAMGISDIIDRSSADSLKPFVTQITGPLIRVVGERSMDVKCAIISTLNQLLEKIPTLLRPFLPQLQRTFTKSIADPTSELLRSQATKALSTLITLTPRVDPLIAELVTGAKTADVGVQNAMLRGLQEVVSKVGANMSDTSRESILAMMDSQLDGGDANMMVTNARLLGAMIKVLPNEKATTLIKGRILTQPSTKASILALNAVLVESASALLSGYAAETRTVLVSGLMSTVTFIQHNAILATGKYLLSEGTVSDHESCQPLFESLSTVIKPGGDIDSRRLALVVVRTVSRHHSLDIRPFLDILIPPIFACVRDPVIPVKLAAEAAFLELFSVVDEESTIWDEYMAGPGKSLPPAQQRPMSDYFKRVALRLGAQSRERREAEGGQGGLGLSSDEQEDEREVWSVGKVEIGDVFADE